VPAAPFLLKINSLQPASVGRHVAGRQSATEFRPVPRSSFTSRPRQPGQESPVSTMQFNRLRRPAAQVRNPSQRSSAALNRFLFDIFFAFRLQDPLTTSL